MTAEPLRLSRRAVLAGLLAASASRPTSAAEPLRIVSIGGAVTETLYRLGLAERIVGVDTTSLYPAEALGTKASVGYMRALGAEGILSLSPDLVIATEGSGPPDVLRIVEQAGVALVRVPDDPSRTGVTRRIEAVAQAVGAADEGAALVREVEEGFRSLEKDRSRIGKPLRTLVVLSLQNGRPLVGGRSTTADAMLALAGAENAAGTLDGWKPLSDEGVIAAAPEAVVVTERGPGGPAPDPFALPAFSNVPAAAARRLIVMDGLYLLGFGPRTPMAALHLLRALYPDRQAL